MAAKQTFTPTLTIQAADAADATRRVQAVSTILHYIDTENLELLAKKVVKPNVNQKIKQYAVFF